MRGIARERSRPTEAVQCGLHGRSGRSRVPLGSSSTCISPRVHPHSCPACIRTPALRASALLPEADQSPSVRPASAPEGRARLREEDPMFKSSLARALGVAVVALLAVGEASAAPSITDINPTHGPTAGAILLTINGSSFSSTGNSVTIDGNACLPLSEGTNQILCRMPAGTGATNDVVVTDDTGAASPSVNFLYDE